jgi:hypothetical protein
MIEMVLAVDPWRSPDEMKVYCFALDQCGVSEVSPWRPRPQPPRLPLSRRLLKVRDEIVAVGLAG